MAGDDILGGPEPGSSAYTTRPAPAASTRRNPVAGVYRTAMPNGKFINLMRVMFTDFCKMDCHYCPNSSWVPRKRYAFKVDELAGLFDELRQRQTVDGLFLSSGIAGDGSKTTEKLINVVEVIRQRYHFTGYIHLKVMPGAAPHLVEAAHRLGTRLSINMETPAHALMQRISGMKDLQRDILDPMQAIDKLTRQRTNGAIGQATQLVVGAANESDWDIFKRIDHLYGEWGLKRVYYSAFRPVRYTPLQEHPGTPMAREHRLYQVDWLKRIYRFSNDELKLAYDDRGFIPLDADPKTSIAMEQLDAFPLDVNSATKEQLLRVPGLGPISADRIVLARARHKIDAWRDLEAMGVVRKRASPFLAFPGQRPPKAKHLRLELFAQGAAIEFPRLKERAIAPAASPATAPCGEATSCTGCPMYGAPGHPGSEAKGAAMAAA
jgi:predicted DNA-binding helix-hairpin-helix protein